MYGRERGQGGGGGGENGVVHKDTDGHEKVVDFIEGGCHLKGLTRSRKVTMKVL